MKRGEGDLSPSGVLGQRPKVCVCNKTSACVYTTMTFCVGMTSGVSVKCPLDAL